MEMETSESLGVKSKTIQLPVVTRSRKLPNQTLGHFEVDEELKYKQEHQSLRKKMNTELAKLQEVHDLEMKKNRARKSMYYLLGKSMKFSTFFKDRLKEHTKTKDRKKSPLKTLPYNVQEPKFEDILKDTQFQKDMEKEHTIETVKVDITDQINFFKGSLRQYQIEGLTWMTILFENGVNGILADEMGLGKTVQVIALLCHLYERNVDGPFLVIAPLSTIPNWFSEFERFAPDIPVCVFQGTFEERMNQKYKISSGNFKLNNVKVQPVILTSYQVPLLEEPFLNKYKWQYIIVDEGHRIKNSDAQLSKRLRELRSTNRLLLTGTPIHNNLVELWSLLNFIVPHIFRDMETFASLLLVEDMEDKEKIVKEEETTNVINTIHKVLAPFMLRRLKCEVLKELVPKKEVLVYCPISKLQRDLYTYVIQKNMAKLKGDEDAEQEENSYGSTLKRRCTMKGSYRELTDLQWEEILMNNFHKQEEKTTGIKIDKKSIEFVYRITMQNPMMMFKKIVNHPFLVHFPLNPNSEQRELLINEDLVNESGKMLVLDAMLAKLKLRKHKVLLFSTLVMMLDLIEDYLIMRKYSYCRLDGRDKLDSRAKSIKKFNSDPTVFIFILSTRSGGLGLNLTSADTVILYDRDWNPQMDVQAQDRCHRIGQTKPVMVYTLVTKNTIDDRIIKRGVAKRRLEKIVIKDGKFKSIQSENQTKEDEMDLEELKELLNSSDSSTKIHSNGYVFSNKELDKLLDRTELYKELEKLKESPQN